MNGFFTQEQARHLSDQEFAHYAGWGLVVGSPKSHGLTLARVRTELDEMRAVSENEPDCTFCDDLEEDLADVKDKLDEVTDALALMEAERDQLKNDLLAKSNKCDDLDNDKATLQKEIYELETQLKNVLSLAKEQEPR